MEVDEVQNVTDVNLLEVEFQRVETVVRCRSVYHEVLLVVADGEIVDVQSLVVISDMTRHHIPFGIVYCHLRRSDVHIGNLFAL